MHLVISVQPRYSVAVCGKSAVKSFKYHLCQVVDDVKLTYKELHVTIILAQIEACLNLRPLVALPHPEDGIEVSITSVQAKDS